MGSQVDSRVFLMVSLATWRICTFMQHRFCIENIEELFCLFWLLPLFCILAVCVKGLVSGVSKTSNLFSMSNLKILVVGLGVVPKENFSV